MEATIYIYAEHCVMAGHEVPSGVVERYLLENDDRASDDWIEIPITIEQVRFFEEQSPTSGFARRAANAVRKYFA